MNKLQFAVLASGSRGNAVYVQPGNDTGFLIDCGLSKPVLEKRLKMVGKTLDDVRGAFITHSHGDHHHVQCVARLGWRKTYFYHSFPHWFNVHTKITPFRLSHGDCPCYGFRIDYSGMSLAYVVDTDYVPEESLEYLLDLDAIIIETNYREEILRSRSYGNQYIYGDPTARHLSNEQAACILSTINSPRIKHVVMVHVSSRNNTPDFAWNAGKAGAPQASVVVAEQDMPTKTITLMS
jgi:phosphoribosyl 1,2-cyclic phosphodiesterase